VLLEALEDYGGTLIFVSHDRYFVEKLATKIIEVGHGDAVVFPGTYLEFLWHKSQLGVEPVAPPTKKPEPAKPKREPSRPIPQASPNGDGAVQHEVRKRQRSEERRQKQAAAQLQSKIADLESRIADREQAIRELEATMAAPGFYDNHEAAKPLIDRHQVLMWEVGDLMHQWEQLHAAGQATSE
jgi:ATP-binding cassette subfamily F protein 3